MGGTVSGGVGLGEGVSLGLGPLKTSLASLVVTNHVPPPNPRVPIRTDVPAFTVVSLIRWASVPETSSQNKPSLPISSVRYFSRRGEKSNGGWRQSLLGALSFFIMFLKLWSMVLSFLGSSDSCISNRSHFAGVVESFWFLLAV